MYDNIDVRLVQVSEQLNDLFRANNSATLDRHAIGRTVDYDDGMTERDRDILA